LNAEYRRIEQMTQKRMIEMSAQLRQKLFAGEIKASIQDQKTGRMVPIPGQFWASTNAEILTNRRIGYNSNTITGFGGYGPVRICREDIVKAAKPASDPSANLTVEQAPLINAVSKTPIHGLAAGNQPNPLHELIRTIADELNPEDKAPKHGASVFRESINKILLDRTQQRRSDSTIKEALKGTRHMKAAKRKQNKADG
jgi:hypothetical protein